MYKAGKKWLFAIIATASFILVGGQTLASADDTVANNNSVQTNTVQVSQYNTQNTQNTQLNTYSDEKVVNDQLSISNDNQSAVPDDNYNDLSTYGKSLVDQDSQSSSWNKTLALGDYDSVNLNDGIFNSNITSNVVSSEANVPLDFKPGILVYNGSNDTSEQINDNLSDTQKKELNDLSNLWTNSLRNYWSSHNYYYDGSPYQYRYSIATNESIWNDARKIEADRTAANYPYAHTGMVSGYPSVNSIEGYLQDTSEQALHTIRGILPYSALTTSVAENLFMIRANTMLQAEVDLYNKMQSMLWGEALQDGSILNADADSHLGNALNSVLPLEAMSFQKVNSNQWYVTWDFTGVSADDLSNSENQRIEAAQVNISPLVHSDIVNRIESLRTRPIIHSGWEYKNGNTYYRDNNGQFVLGWRLINGYRYYFNPQTAATVTGWRKIGNNRYYFNPKTSVAVTGWQKIGNNRYYFNPKTSVAVTGWQKIGNNRYYFNPKTSVAVTGWQKIGTNRYYFNPKTSVATTGWQKLGTNRYYFNLKTSSAVVGLQRLGNDWYYFNPANSQAVTGWRRVGTGRYYFDTSNARAVTGWRMIGNNRYYFDLTTAQAVTGWHKVGNNRYYFNPYTSVAATGLQKVGNNWYYFSPLSSCSIMGWQKLGNKWYLFGRGGEALEGQYKFSDIKMHFSADGWLYWGSFGSGYNVRPSGDIVTCDPLDFTDSPSTILPASGLKKIGNYLYYVYPNTGQLATGFIGVKDRYGDGVSEYYFDPQSGRAVSDVTKKITQAKYTFENGALTYFSETGDGISLVPDSFAK